MNIFPILKDSDENEAFSEILGYQVLDEKGNILARGEDMDECREKALIAMYLAECNEATSKKITLHPKLLNKKVAQGCK
jgi:hypothetical protein